MLEVRSEKFSSVWTKTLTPSTISGLATPHAVMRGRLPTRALRPLNSVSSAI